MTHAFALPDGLGLGVATSATQIEGGDAATIWHRWADGPDTGAIDGSTPRVACDHWNRVEDDTALMASLGIRHYRLGLEWARIEPRPGVFDADAIAHYRRELTALRAAGISPLVTLHHFNDPVWFSDAGGFLGEDAMPSFLRYVRHVVRELGDLAHEWITINEPNVFAVGGYYEGNWPPSRRSMPDAIRIQGAFARAHIHAFQHIHRLQPHARVGFAQHLAEFAPRAEGNPVDRASATTIEHLFQGMGTQAALTGVFPLPLVAPREIRPGTYADFLGINFYSRHLVRGLGYRMASGVPVNDLGWEITPEAFVRTLRRYHERFDLPIYVTENGTADAADAFRPRFIYEHLKALVESGLPVERYYHWTFTDNWEWAEGETGRFGLVALDFETQTRVVRESGRFYADIIANGGVTEDAYERWVAGVEYPQG